MKKAISLFMTAILILSVTLLFAGCGETSVDVESITSADDSFSGARVFKITLPGAIGAAKAVDILNASMPDMGENAGCISVSQNEESNAANQIEVALNFSSIEDYEDKISTIINKEVTVNLAQPDNILLKGTRYTEDFDGSEVLVWVKNAFENNFDVTRLQFNFISNVVNLSGELHTTESTANINEVEGCGISKISVSTANTKDDLYDREFVFEIPEDVYNELGDDLRVFFVASTNELAHYSDWSTKGSFREYQVKFKGLSVEELQYVTNQIMNADDCTIEYGDFTNSSTPLSEGLTFAESVNTMNYMSVGKGFVPVDYTYSLPTNTTYSEGSVLENGSWINAGSWNDYTYSLSFDTGEKSIHIPDGIQYKISGMSFYLNNKGGNSFKRTVDILYAKDSKDGVNYAFDYFKNKGAVTSTDETTDNYICRIETEGTALEISKVTNFLFGGGNYLDYEYSQNPFDVSDNTTAIDYINLGYMLTSDNAEKPMTYTVTKSGNENISRVDLSSDAVKSRLDTADENGAFTLEFTGGNARVTYSGNIVDWGKATIFIVISCIMTIVAGGLIYYFIRKSSAAKSASSNMAPQQTTTFLIKDLNKKKNSGDDE